jgi:tetratricopeptide (TPR) repeat protein
VGFWQAFLDFIYWHQGCYDWLRRICLDYSIEELLGKARLAAENISFPATRCRLLTQIADYYFQHRNTVESAAVLAEALKAADLLKHPDEKARQLAWLARLLKEAGDPAKAAEQFKRSYYLARAAESVSQKVGALYYLASEYVDAGLPAESKTILAELEPLVLDPASQVDSVCELINIAEIFTDIDDNAGTQDSLNRAVEAARNLKDLWFKAERLIEIAETYLGAGYSAEAAQLIQEAVSEVDKVEECSRPYFWMKLAAVYHDLNLTATAFDCLLKARQAVLRSEDLNTAAGDVLELAESYFSLEDRINALSLLEKAQTIIGDLPENQDRVQRLLESADLYNRLGADNQALELVDRVYQLYTSILDNKARLYILGRLALLCVNLKNNAKAVQLIDEISRIVNEGKTRSSGLGPIAEELAGSGNYALALRLAEIIREPEVKAAVFIAVAKNLLPNQIR